MGPMGLQGRVLLSLASSSKSAVARGLWHASAAVVLRVGVCAWGEVGSVAAGKWARGEMSRLQMRVGGEEGAGAQRQNSQNKCVCFWCFQPQMVLWWCPIPSSQAESMCFTKLLRLPSHQKT